MTSSVMIMGRLPAPPRRDAVVDRGRVFLGPTSLWLTMDEIGVAL
jgi:hypothetical protein